MTKIAAALIYGKNPLNFLPNERANDPGAWCAALGTLATYSLKNYQPCFDLDRFYGRVKLFYVLQMAKQKKFLSEIIRPRRLIFGR